MPFLVLGISHHSAGVGQRERLAITDPQLPQALRETRESSAAQELVVLSTCNRVELYAICEGGEAESFQALWRGLARSRNYQGEMDPGVYTLSGRQGIRHLYRVACGLDSMILGETEVLGQLKQAYRLALEGGHSGRRLNRIFQKAFQVAKQVRTDTGIQKGPTSVASAAVELAERIFDGLEGHHVMVLGAGDTSEKTARALLSRGASSILVSNRSHERAVRLAKELGGEAIGFDQWDRVFPRIDIVISSTASPRPFLDRDLFLGLSRNRPARPLLLIDIAVPRDIDPTVGLLPNTYLYNIDDLQSLADERRQRRTREVERCEALIESHIDETLDRLSGSALSMLCGLLPGGRRQGEKEGGRRR